MSPSFAFASTTRGLTTVMIGSADRNGAYGLSSTNRTVRVSGAVMFSLFSTGRNAPDGALPRARIRRTEYTTSSAVISLPSWNLTPSRSVKSQVRPSSETVWLLASQGSRAGGLPW